MKKILLLIDNLGSGGAQNQITLLACQLKSKGYDVSVFSYFPQDFFADRLIKAGVKLLYCRKRGTLGINVILALWRFINKEKIEVLISFLDTPNFYAVVVKKLSRLIIKVIISYRSFTNFNTLSKFKLFQREWVNKNCDIIVSNSHHERKRWQDKYPNQATKWITIYNAIDKRQFFLNQKFSVDKTYLVVGSISSDKNGLLILDAMRLLQNKKIYINLVWVGQKIYNLSNRRKYLEEMENKIANCNLQSYFIWEKPVLEIEKFYRSHRALILASRIEGLPNVVCEALSCGTPCLVSNVLDHPNLVKDGISGFLFNLDSPNSLAKAIEKMENLSQKEYIDMSNNASRDAKALFDLELFTNHFIKIIES